MTIKLKTTDNQTVELNPKAIQSLSGKISGNIIAPGDSAYDHERQLWNGMIDRKPGLIVQCTGKEDIITAVRFANAHHALISVRGAGHNIAGRAIQDDVLMIDLSKLRGVKVDPGTKAAIVSPGATLGDIDKATMPYGLALPVGVNSTTGIAGLTLGGGFGWLSPKHGMTIDNLLSVEAINVKGELLHCDAKTNEELFWAIRGGGGNFAIVGEFTFQLVPMPQKVLCGPVVFDIEEAEQVLANYRDFILKTPRHFSIWAAMRYGHPFPFLTKEQQGRPVFILVGCHFGSEEEGEELFSQLKALGSPIGSHIEKAPFVDFQQAFDPTVPPGGRNYWKTHNFKKLDDNLIKTIVGLAKNLPSEESELFIARMGGAINEVPPDATAYPHRDAEFVMNIHTRWQDKESDQTCIEWARKVYAETKPFSSGGVYSNFVSDGDDNTDEAYGQNAERLKTIKSKFDPDNVLRNNLNIIPD